MLGEPTTGLLLCHAHPTCSLWMRLVREPGVGSGERVKREPGAGIVVRNP
jgi:hypothetical protein